jgi:hypothetical protein
MARLHSAFPKDRPNTATSKMFLNSNIKYLQRLYSSF